MNIKSKENKINISSILDVSVVVCTMNAANTIVECLKSIKENNPREIILVDAHSTDGTQELAKPYITKEYEDPGLGLAMARNIGLEHANGKYICYVGPDNILQSGTLRYCIDYLNKHNHIGVSTQTIIKNSSSSYLSHVMNLYKKARLFPGLRSVIGTPQLFISDILRKNKFDENMTWSDDSDLCFRLLQLGYTFGIADTFVYETGTDNIVSVLRRWKGYGLSDFEYYRKYSRKWKLKRKIVSFLHPFLSEFQGSLVSSRLKMKEKIEIAPFLLFITVLRYIYWIKYSIKNLISPRLKK